MTLSVESELYALQTCQITNQNLLIRKKDNAIAYIRDEHCSLLLGHDSDFIAFDNICNTFTFIDNITEKEAVQ